VQAQRSPWAWPGVLVSVCSSTGMLPHVPQSRWSLHTVLALSGCGPEAVVIRLGLGLGLG
jgi:hypothetical protein